MNLELKVSGALKNQQSTRQQCPLSIQQDPCCSWHRPVSKKQGQLVNPVPNLVYSFILLQARSCQPFGHFSDVSCWLEVCFQLHVHPTGQLWQLKMLTRSLRYIGLGGEEYFGCSCRCHEQEGHVAVLPCTLCMSNECVLPGCLPMFCSFLTSLKDG